MTNTAYYDDNGNSQLVCSYCVFADFLGFTHEIKTAISNGTEKTVFRQFMDQIEPCIDSIIQPEIDETDSQYQRMWDAKVFTDNIVLGYILWSDTGENEFGHAIAQLLEFQFAVAMKGFFIRGGWSIGNLFMNRNIVFGGSLLEAVEIETTKANFPRILLSDSMREVVHMHMARYGEDPPQIYHLMKDANGALFTNYLFETVEDGKVNWDDLHRHCKLISMRLLEHQSNNRVFPKYQWLAAYHNFFCDQVASGYGYTDSVRVKGQFPDFGIKLLTLEDSPHARDAMQERAKRTAKIAKSRESE